MSESLERAGVGRRNKPSANTRTIDEPPSEATRENNRLREAAADGIVATTENGANVPEDGDTIVSIIKGLEGQVDTAFKLKEILEGDLRATLKRLSEEMAARTELKARVEALEPRAAQVDRLRADIEFTEEERDKFANSLRKTRQQLEAVTAERDSLVKEAASAKAHAEELEGEKTTLEAQVMNFTDQVKDLDRVRRELAGATEARRDLGEQVRDLSNRLKASDALKSTLEGDLAEAREAVRRLRGEAEDLRQKLARADSRVADLRLELDEQQTANRDLMEIKTRLESEARTMKVDHEAAKNELQAVKKTLRDVSSELTSTSRRVRQRYLKEKDNEREGAEAASRGVAAEPTSTSAPARGPQIEVADTESPPPV